MSRFYRNRLKYTVNENFFNKWSRQMAYVLGFTYADGNIYKNSLSWEIQSRDLKLLKKFKKVLTTTYPISKTSRSVRLRIHNQVLVKSAMDKGLIDRKSFRIKLPDIPKQFIRHFIRGFLDGDGWVVKRNRRNEVDFGFVSCNNRFIEDLSLIIYRETGLRARVRERNKITKKGIKSIVFTMEYYSNNAMRLGAWLYGDLNKNDIFLNRKYIKYTQSIRLYEYLNSGTRRARTIQKKLGRSIRDILYRLFIIEHLTGEQIAEVLKVHSSSIYRWLAREGIKYPVHRKTVYDG